MKFAVIETGGKQYLVRPGLNLRIEKIEGSEDWPEGKEFDFNKVLLFNDGAESEIGAPCISGLTVKAIFKGNGRSKKIDILKYKAKARYRVRHGHRQHFSKVAFV